MNIYLIQSIVIILMVIVTTIVKIDFNCENEFVYLMIGYIFGLANAVIYIILK